MLNHQKAIDPTNRDTLSKSFYGVGAELGVAVGGFSNSILLNSSCNKLYSIDRWSKERGHDDQQYKKAQNLLSKFKHRSKIIRTSFKEAALEFSNQSLDFIYIDGYAHTGQDNGATLQQWWPKLKCGGIFAGHDYSKKWPLTVQMVNAFVARNDLHLKTTKESDNESDKNDDCPSWYIIKRYR